jgi:hypothetical protein
MERAGTGHLPTVGWKDVPNSQAPNPKESPNSNTQIQQEESVGACIVEDSLDFGFWNLAFRRDAAVSV